MARNIATKLALPWGKPTGGEDSRWRVQIETEVREGPPRHTAVGYGFNGITTFFGGNDPWYVIVPNERLIGVTNDACEYATLQSNGRSGWFMAKIPLTTKPDDPKDDEIPLMGLASSFFVREIHGQYVMEHEIFHV